MGLGKLPPKLAQEITVEYYGKRKDNKYNATSCHCLSKHWHQSIFESGICNSLLADKQAGKIFDFKTQHGIYLGVNGKRIYKHYVDFAVLDAGGNIVEFVEAKGQPTDLWEVLHKLTVALYPNIPYRVEWLKDRQDRRWGAIRKNLKSGR